MFGGVGFLLLGHICVGVWKDSLVVRVGPEHYEEAVREPFVGEFDIHGAADDWLDAGWAGGRRG